MVKLYLVKFSIIILALSNVVSTINISFISLIVDSFTSILNKVFSIQKGKIPYVVSLNCTKGLHLLSVKFKNPNNNVILFPLSKKLKLISFKDLITT